MEDIVSLLIYLLLILVTLITGVYQARKKKFQIPGPQAGEDDHNWEADNRPDSGPLSEIFDLDPRKEPPPVYENLEDDTSVENGAEEVERSHLYEPMTVEDIGPPEVPVIRELKLTGEVFAEGQSGLREYDALMDQTVYDSNLEDISAGEIVSEEVAAEIEARKPKKEWLDMRKAIIYSEILKRREI